MPIYHYRCVECDNRIEVICPIKEKDSYLEKECEVCGCKEHESMITKNTFKLKGGGWYKDGYN